MLTNPQSMAIEHVFTNDLNPIAALTNRNTQSEQAYKILKSISKSLILPESKDSHIKTLIFL